jgi:hypothetical protein
MLPRRMLPFALAIASGLVLLVIDRSAQAAVTCRMVRVDPKCWGDLCETRRVCSHNPGDLVQKTRPYYGSRPNYGSQK